MVDVPLRRRRALVDVVRRRRAVEAARARRVHRVAEEDEVGRRRRAAEVLALALTYVEIRVWEWWEKRNG